MKSINRKQNGISLYHALLRNTKKTKAIFAPLVVCFITGLLLLSLFLFYTQNLQNMVEEENYRYLKEISSQIESNMKDKLEFHYSTIQTLGNIVEREKENSLYSVLVHLDEEKDDYRYQSIGLIDENGYLYSTKGRMLFSDLLPFISVMNQNAQSVTSNIMNLNNKDSVAFLSPLPPILIDSITFKGIVAISDMDTLSDALSLSMFENQGFAHIVTNTGTVIVRSNNVNNFFDGYNILSYFEQETTLQDITSDELRQQMLNHQSGEFQYIRSDGEKIQAFYAPANEANWYLFSVIPSRILTERTSGFYQQTVMACSVLTIIFLSLIAIIVISQQQRKRELMHVVYTDPVTKGRSKLKFEEDALAALKVNHCEYSLIYINIDKFKLLNEQNGRVQADTLLENIYNIIQNRIAKIDYSYVTRLMADHFGVLLHLHNLDEIKKIITECNESIESYAIEKNFSIPVKITCGLYLLDQQDAVNDIFILLDKANAARKMLNKQNNEGIVAVYDEALRQRIHQEQELELHQEAALANGEFKMFLQPKYNPQTNEIAGAEGLTRWISEQGIVYPDQFIPLFETNGFIVKLDLYIFEEACRFIDDMIKKGYQPVPISVNLSRRNLTVPNFVDRYVEIWKKYQFDPHYLEFEITENLIYENLELLDKTIENLHEHGFLVSMDDFGSGYSSLNMLKNVNVDFVKLDREFFLSKQTYSQKGKIIVNAMIDLCKELGISVVSEGIETKHQVEFLRKMGCDLIQGYYYSKPIPKEELMDQMIQMQEGN